MMEMNDLTRSQFILLVLFVAFFSSMVTGITVVSLMEQAPKDVTRVIQRTVVQTVEKVTPPEVQTKVITQEKKVIVSEADTIKTAIAKIKPSVVKVYSSDGQNFYFNGVVVSSNGLVLVPQTPQKEFKIISDGKEYKAVKKKDERGFSILQITDSESIPKPAAILTQSPVLGSKVALIYGNENFTVLDGIVSSYKKDSVIVSIRGSVPLGAVLVSSTGALVSVASSHEASSGVYTAPEVILSIIESVANQQNTQDSQNTQSQQDNQQNESNQQANQSSSTTTSESE